VNRLADFALPGFFLVVLATVWASERVVREDQPPGPVRIT